MELEIIDKITSRQFELAEQLIRDNTSTININYENPEHHTILHRACSHHSNDIVKLLLSDELKFKEPLDIYVYDWTGRNAFALACIAGNIKAVKMFLRDKRFDIDKSMNKNGTQRLLNLQAAMCGLSSGVKQFTMIQIIEYLIVHQKSFIHIIKPSFGGITSNISNLISEYNEDPVKVVKQMRKKHYKDEMSTQVFVLIKAIKCDFFRIK